MVAHWHVVGGKMHGFIEQTNPNAKRSKLQKYRLTAKGRECLVGLESRQQLG